MIRLRTSIAFAPYVSRKDAETNPIELILVHSFAGARATYFSENIWFRFRGTGLWAFLRILL